MDHTAFGNSRRTVLVVDDSPVMLRYLQTILELAAFQVETACDGEEALRRIREGAVPDVVLLDLEMPRLDGISTLRHLAEFHPTLPVIMCSGVDDPTIVEFASQLGARAYLRKPVQQLYLTAALERCLPPSTSSQSAASGAP